MEPSTRARNTRVFLPPAEAADGSKDTAAYKTGDVVSLSATDSHHVSNVVRLGRGDQIVAVCTLSGKEFDAVIIAANPLVSVSLDRQLAPHNSPSRSDQLFVPLLKGDHLEFAIEKATELGAAQINLYQADRSVVRLSQGQASKKMERWRRIAESAAKQSSRLQLPELSYSESLLLALGSRSEGFYGALTPSARPLRHYAPPLHSAVLVVGPEGDFSPEEEQLFVERRFNPVSLGSLVLRAETAAMVLLAAAQAVWGSPSRDEMPGL